MTFSIIARCERTGQLGVATQSHWPFTGSQVPWAESGVGVVATQATTEPAYGPRALSLLTSGTTAVEALNAVLATDAAPEVRQVAVMSVDGSSAHHSGEACIGLTATEQAEDAVCIGNLLATDQVIPAMMAAWKENENEDLGWRLLACLDAAQGAGGDIRGQQAAALKVVTGERSQPWLGVLADIRVDDDPQPLVRLRHLLNVREAYNEARSGDVANTDGDLEAALGFYNRAQARLPDSPEIAFWRSILLANSGYLRGAADAFTVCSGVNSGWETLLRRAQESGRLRLDPTELETMLGR